MIKKTIKYTDYNGVEREEDFYFNLNEAEVAELEYSVEGSMSELMKSISTAQDMATIIQTFKTIIRKSYGIKSPDGRRFMKSEEISDSFCQTPAYPILFMELASDDVAGAAFVNGIMPQSNT